MKNQATNPRDDIAQIVQIEATDDEIVHANVAHILANPDKLYDHQRGRLDAVAVLEMGIYERSVTVRQHRACPSWQLNEWSCSVVTRLEREIRLVKQIIHKLRMLGIDTKSPKALQLRREREVLPPSFRDIITPILNSPESNSLPPTVAALLDPEKPVPGVTTGKIREELREIAKLNGSDLNIKAGWGRAGKGGIVMPAKGRITSRDNDILDIWLNDTTRWESIPRTVWEYTLGGYQVLKKWLSYREAGLLGRAVTPDEARDFTHNARRIAALLQLSARLDANYEAVKSSTVPLTP